MAQNKISAEKLNLLSKGSMIDHLGIEILETGEDFITGKMPVDHRTFQPFKILHGGASIVLAETLGSFGSYCLVDPSLFQCVGIEINANHLRSVKEGFVYGKAVIRHQGRSTHVWQIDIVNENNQLVCTGRLTIAVIEIKKDKNEK